MIPEPLTQTKLETPIKNLMNLYVAKSLLGSEHYDEFWDKVKDTGYITKEGAKALWIGLVEEQEARYGELGGSDNGVD